jgi:hypothetical protein
MCTVTFVPLKEAMVLTSNRDEWNTRGTAMAPEQISGSFGNILLYPQDSDKGGTWIVANNNGDAAVLLNGAFRNHVREKTYRRSRGKILLDIMNTANPVETWEEINLSNIEAFTLIIYSKGRLCELRWDGLKKHSLVLCSRTSYIWSSVTLYDEQMIESRKMWFQEWRGRVPNATVTDIMQFHQTGGDNDSGRSLLLNRDGKIATVSITSIDLSTEQIQMTHHDLRNGGRSHSTLQLTPVQFTK